MLDVSGDILKIAAEFQALRIGGGSSSSTASVSPYTNVRAAELASADLQNRIVTGDAWRASETTRAIRGLRA